jgi:Carbohydrate esterase 2 N-terminal/GDSL-like Lipase/Acylhydrolase family
MVHRLGFGPMGRHNGCDEDSMRPSLMVAALAASSAVPNIAEEPVLPRLILPSDSRVAIMGRVDRGEPNRVRMGFPGVTIRLAFEGPSLSIRAADTSGHSSFAVVIDNGDPRTLRCDQGEHEYLLASHLAQGRHTVDIVRRSETWQGIVTFLGVRLASGQVLLPPAPWPRRKLLFIGDSVTAGEMIDREPTCPGDPFGPSNARESYAMLLARTLDAQCHLVAYGGRGVIRDWQGKSDVLNAPQFFDLAVPDEPGPAPAWDHSLYVPDAVFVSLGTNDFNLALGALPEREVFVSTYVRLLRAVRERYPQAQVFVTEGAIVNDESDSERKPKSTLREYLDETVRRLGDPRIRHVEAEHYPGDPCNAHPTREQHCLMARDIEPVLRAALGW